MKCITINTDASFNHIYKKGGYAFWIVCDQFVIKSGGMFKSDPKNPEEAEIMCIGNAIATILKRNDLPELTWLVINTDCINGSLKIKRNSTPLSKSVNKLRCQLQGKLKAKKSEIRHVKAHSKKNDARSVVNEWCDKEAKKWMHIAIKSHPDYPNNA